MNITGAIFDMDGTLVDSLMVWDVLWQRLGKKYLGNERFRPDPVTEKAVRTLTLIDAMTLVHEKCGIGESGEEVWQFTTDMMVDFYENDVKMKAGALDFLEYLYGEGVKMCIASATAPNLISIAMKTCGLGKYFSKVISCNDVGKGKEHPDVFIAAHEYLGTSKDSTWVFEDSVAAIETAVSAGYKTVGIYDQYNFGLDRIPSIATVYIDKGESLTKLIEK
jgi:HAD superfamily hydrolase (TIGR01509 family)